VVVREPFQHGCEIHLADVMPHGDQFLLFQPHFVGKLENCGHVFFHFRRNFPVLQFARV